MFGMADVQLADTLLDKLLRDKNANEVRSLSISRIILEAGLSAKQARDLCKQRYAKLLTEVAQDDHIDDTEEERLQAYKGVLSISDAEIAEIERTILHPRIHKAVDNALSDERLTEDEKANLKVLSKRLRVSESSLTRITQMRAQEIIQEQADVLLADKRYSPEDETALKELAIAIGGQLEVDADTQAVLRKYRLLWDIDNGDIPTIPAAISLFKGEKCYSEVVADWYELRTKTTSVSYHGPTVSIRIAKGVRYRLGNITPIRHTAEQLTKIDSGKLYVTDRRIIFTGAKRNSTLRFSTLLGFTPYSDGVKIEKSTGRSPVLILSGVDMDVFHAILASALSVEID